MEAVEPLSDGDIALDRVRNSEAWDPKFGLPLYPSHNNPWIYTAYAALLLRIHGAPEQDLRWNVCHYWVLCQEDARSGYFYRWPDHAFGGKTSHDEVIGACFLLDGAALRIADYLNANDGNFKAAGNIYRIPCVRPYVQARAYRKLSLLSQLLWIGYLLAGFWRFNPVDVGPHLRRWLMCHHMRAFPLCASAIKYWALRMNRSGLTLKAALTIEPGSALAAIAPDEWTWPALEDRNATLGS